MKDEKIILENSKTLLRMIHNVNLDIGPMFIYHLETNLIIAANSLFSNIWGYESGEEIIGQQIPQVSSVIKSVDVGNRKEEIELIDINGNTKYFIQKKWKHEENCIFILWTDITIQKMAERRVIDANQKYRNIISATQMAFSILDPRLNILEGNRFFWEIMDINDEGSKKNNILHLLKMTDTRKNSFKIQMERLVEDPSSVKPLVFNIHANSLSGKTINLECTSNSFLNGVSGQEIKIFCIFKNLEALSMKKQKEFITKNKERDSFLQNIKNLRDQGWGD